MTKVLPNPSEGITIRNIAKDSKAVDFSNYLRVIMLFTLEFWSKLLLISLEGCSNTGVITNGHYLKLQIIHYSC